MDDETLDALRANGYQVSFDPGNATVTVSGLSRNIAVGHVLKLDGGGEIWSGVVDSDGTSLLTRSDQPRAPSWP